MKKMTVTIDAPVQPEPDLASQVARITTDSEAAFVAEQLALITANAKGNSELASRGRRNFLLACLREKQEGGSVGPTPGNLPTLQSLRLFKHSHVQYDSGQVDCRGNLQVVEVFGTYTADGFTYRRAYAMLECEACRDRVVVKNPQAQVVVKKQERGFKRASDPDRKRVANGEREL